MIDFATRFPHRYWLSSWSKDDQYPKGFRYKLLSTRPEPSGLIEFVVVLEEPGGIETEVNRVEVSAPAFEKTATLYVDGLSESGNLMFFAVDLTRCRTAEDLERIVSDAGWYEPAP
jgi:hypothetical protein